MPSTMSPSFRNRLRILSIAQDKLGFGRAVALAIAMGSTGAGAAQPQSVASDRNDLTTVVITAGTPLSLPEEDVGGVPVQVASAEDIQRTHAVDLSAFMNRMLGSVHINGLQGNPLQPDVNYRGYTASPLLGTPQGLSVYLDGVRLNQPFGDVVSWDLIPRAAISTLALVPGSNPVYGLNSLGGALALRSKDGFADPGTRVETSFGSFGRTQIEAQTGGSRGDWGWYLTANRLHEDGWREASPTDARQVFAKLGWRHAATTLALTAAAARTALAGNGLQEQRLLAADQASVYTRPDQTDNRSVLLNLELGQRLSQHLTLAANVWYRQLETDTLNGDLNEESLGQSLYQPSAAERAALAAAGYSGFPLSGESQLNTPFPRWRCIANALLNDEPNEKCNGLLTRTGTVQRVSGATAQLSWDAPLGRLANQLILGAAWQRAHMQFLQSSQFGYLAEDRSVVVVQGPGAFADGTQSSENAFDARVDLAGNAQVHSLYFSDTLRLAAPVELTLAGRFDSHRVRNRDALTPGGGPGSLDGDHRFSRFNPSIGLRYGADTALSAYVRYSQGSRAPSSIELGCADPANPCRLPNAMAGDPPLRQVVTRNWEAGLRGSASQALIWSAGVFRADNRDDILFVADDQAGYGYFRNVDATRRQGIELSADGRLGAVLVGLNVTVLDATFRSAETLQGSSNSSAAAVAPGFEGTIDVQVGDRIPLVPRHIIKARLNWNPAPRWSVDADMAYVGAALARGNENGRHAADGVYYLGPGSSAGYTVANLGVEWQADEAVTVFAQVDNLLDRHYATAAQLGATGFTANGSFVARPFAAPIINGERPLLHSTFFAPGAPRTTWVGLRLTLP